VRSRAVAGRRCGWPASSPRALSSALGSQGLRGRIASKLALNLLTAARAYNQDREAETTTL
jgi:hypothetical protein